jgi:hypothetical protein
LEACWPCPVFVNYTPAFALQLREKHGKTSVSVAEEIQKNHEGTMEFIGITSTANFTIRESQMFIIDYRSIRTGKLQRREESYHACVPYTKHTLENELGRL